MTEKEKMERGEWHDANFDEELLAQRAKAEALCYDFNMAKPGSAAQLDALKSLLDTDLPEGLTVLSPAYFDYGSKTTFGEGCFVNHGCYFMDGGSITFGDNVFIGPFCGFYTASHPLKAKDRNLGLEKALPIVVGDNCWFWRERVRAAGGYHRQRLRNCRGQRRDGRPSGQRGGGRRPRSYQEDYRAITKPLNDNAPLSSVECGARKPSSTPQTTFNAQWAGSGYPEPAHFDVR